MRRTMDGGDDFTFAAAQPPPRLLSAVGGGGGCMGPPLLYPIFGRPRSPPRAAPAPEPVTATARVPLGRLLLVDKDPSPPPAPAPADDVVDDEGLDSVPAEMFCPWSPGWSASAAAAASSPARCKKSGSTGSVLRWRPRLVVGRSQSDGKEKFVFFSAASSGGSFGRRNQKGRGAVEGANGAASAGSAGAGAAHAWSYYVKNNNGGGARRRSFLPYKQDLVGLFANAAVFRRSYLPF